MKRLFHVLLTIALAASVLCTAYFLIEILQSAILANDEESIYRNYGVSPHYDSFAEYLRFMVYYGMGLLGLLVSNRLVKQEFLLNAYVISFSYLLLLGANGGIDWGRQLTLKLCLNIANVIIFTYIYHRFVKKYYRRDIPCNFEREGD